MAASSSSTSSSSLITETISGSHDFKITGYSFNKGIGVGKSLTSEKFTVGGYSWKIDFYPDGYGYTKQDTEGSDAYVSIFVNLVNGTNVKAKFDIALLDQSGNEKCVRKCLLHTFTNFGWGWDKFLKQMELEANYLKDDCVHIRCRIGVVISRTEVREICSIPVPPSDIAQHFGRLLRSGKGGDVNFKVDGEEFVAHKLVLATRSAVFDAQFFGSMNDQNERSIKIEEMKAPIFEAMLHFIYLDTLPKELIEIKSRNESTLMFQDLLTAADRYNLDRLVMICAAKLYDDIAIDNAITTLALAEQHHCMPLKLACLKFIARSENLQGVRNSEAFKYHKESRSIAYTELLEYLAGW